MDTYVALTVIGFTHITGNTQLQGCPQQVQETTQVSQVDGRNRVLGPLSAAAWGVLAGSRIRRGGGFHQTL